MHPAGWKTRKRGSPSQQVNSRQGQGDLPDFPPRSLSLPLPTWPKFTAACWAEAVKITTVRYSDNFSLVLMDLGKPKAELWAG